MCWHSIRCPPSALATELCRCNSREYWCFQAFSHLFTCFKPLAVQPFQGVRSILAYQIFPNCPSQCSPGLLKNLPLKILSHQVLSRRKDENELFYNKKFSQLAQIQPATGRGSSLIFPTWSQLCAPIPFLPLAFTYHRQDQEDDLSPGWFSPPLSRQFSAWAVSWSTWLLNSTNMNANRRKGVRTSVTAPFHSSMISTASWSSWKGSAPRPRKSTTYGSHRLASRKS